MTTTAMFHDTKCEPHPTLKIFCMDEQTRELYKDVVNFNTDSGYDLRFPSTVKVPPILNTKGLGYKVGLGIKVEMEGSEGQSLPFLLVPRSSIYKTPLRQSNSIGIIDAGYRGELCVPLDNACLKPYTIKQGDRLFQIVRPNLAPFSVTFVSKEDELSRTERGEDGFGSTGK